MKEQSLRALTATMVLSAMAVSAALFASQAAFAQKRGGFYKNT